MLTVLLRAPLSVVREHAATYFPKARLKYNEKKRLTAVQDDELADWGEERIRTIARMRGLPLVAVVDIKPFRGE